MYSVCTLLQGSLLAYFSGVYVGLRLWVCDGFSLGRSDRTGTMGFHNVLYVQLLRFMIFKSISGA